MQHRANYEPASQVLPDLFSAINFEEEIKRIYDEKVAEKKCANVQDLYQWLLKKTNFNSNLVNKTSNNISNNDGHDEYDEVNLLKIIQSLNILTLLEQQEAKNIDQLVRLSTIHAAKGLEFNNVFLIGAEEGVLPSTPREPNADLEEFIIEERRLMYVAITRAKFNLWISWNQAPSNPWDQEKKGKNSSSKNSSNSVSGANNILKANQPSRFIKEMKLEEFKTNMMDLSHKLANAGLIDVSEINAYQQKENIKQQSIQEMEQKSDIREKLAFLRQQLKG
jgi:superfamily I DNA/RNA helicase